MEGIEVHGDREYGSLRLTVHVYPIYLSPSYPLYIPYTPRVPSFHRGVLYHGRYLVEYRGIGIGILVVGIVQWVWVSIPRSI